VFCQLRTEREEIFIVVKAGCVLCEVRIEVEETVQHRALSDAK